MKIGKLRTSQTLLQASVIMLISAIFAVPLYGAKKVYLKVGSSVNLPTIGVNFRLCKGLEANPTGSIKVQKLPRSQGSTTTTLNAYDPRDLWLRDQQAGRWISDQAALSIYTLTMPPPKNIPKLYKNLVSKEKFDEWGKKQSEEKVKWSDENISNWLHFLTGKQFTAPPPLKRGAPLQSVTKIFTTDSAPNELFFIVVSNYTKDHPILFHYTFSPQLDRTKSIKTIASTLSSMRLSKPKIASSSSKKRNLGSSQSLQKNRKDRAPEYVASRDAVIKSISNLKEWWYIETDNFVMVANIKNKKTARDISTNLEKSRKIYTQFYPVKVPLKAVSVARMFEERDQYVSYVGEELKWSGGVWIPRIKELVVSPMNWGSRTERRKMMIETTFHEAFHQYLFFASGERNNALWFNEGNAQLFEEIQFRGSKASIGINPRKAAKMKQLTSLDKIQKMLKMGGEEFYSATGRDENYALAWGIIFFLQKGAPVMKEKNNYHEIPTEYYNAIIKTGNPTKATNIAWKEIDIEQFANDFDEFWNSKNLIKKAIRYDPLKK